MWPALRCMSVRNKLCSLLGQHMMTVLNGTTLKSSHPVLVCMYLPQICDVKACSALALALPFYQFDSEESFFHAMQLWGS